MEMKAIVSDLCTIEIGPLIHWLHTSQMALLKACTTGNQTNGNEDHDVAASKVIGASPVTFKAQTDETRMQGHTLL